MNCINAPQSFHILWLKVYIWANASESSVLAVSEGVECNYNLTYRPLLVVLNASVFSFSILCQYTYHYTNLPQTNRTKNVIMGGFYSLHYLKCVMSSSIQPISLLSTFQGTVAIQWRTQDMRRRGFHFLLATHHIPEFWHTLGEEVISMGVVVTWLVTTVTNIISP